MAEKERQTHKNEEEHETIREEYRRRSWWWHTWFIVIGIVILAMLYFFYGFPNFDIGPAQPIFFSHRVHAGVKQIDCRFCHPFADRSRNAGLPPMEKCFFCHKYVIPLHPQIFSEREHFMAGKPVVWKRIFFVPDFVKFTHVPHVKIAGFECDTCHGAVEKRDRLRVHHFKMGFCVNCHIQYDAQRDCWLACHR